MQVVASSEALALTTVPVDAQSAIEQKFAVSSTERALYQLLTHHMSPYKIAATFCDQSVYANKALVQYELARLLLRVIDLSKIIRMLKWNKLPLDHAIGKILLQRDGVWSAVDHAILIALLAQMNPKFVKKRKTFSQLLDHAVRYGDRLGVLYLLVGGAKPNKCVNNIKGYSIVDNAIYRLCRGSVDPFVGVATICMLLSAGARVKLSCDMGLKQGRLGCAMSSVITNLVDGWKDGTRDQRVDAIQELLCLAKSDRTAVKHEADDMVMTCHLIEVSVTRSLEEKLDELLSLSAIEMGSCE
jgi:hypothetical protein